MICHSMGGPRLVAPGTNRWTRTRCISGSTLERYFLAKVSFTIATGRAPVTSCSVKLRPLIISIPKVSKYSGVTMVKPAPGREEGRSEERRVGKECGARWMQWRGRKNKDGRR